MPCHLATPACASIRPYPSCREAVGVGGLEPPTPASQTRCATNCATPRSAASIMPASPRRQAKTPMTPPEGVTRMRKSARLQSAPKLTATAWMLIIAVSCVGSPDVPLTPLSLRDPVPVLTLAIIRATETPIPNTARPTWATATRFPTPLPTWTALPTLNPLEAKRTLRRLQKTNADCVLPCWWGITPGVTSLGTTRQLMETYGVRFALWNWTLLEKAGGTVVSSSYELGFPDDPAFDDWRVSIGAVGDRVSWIDLSDVTSGSKFSLGSLLHEYGPPEDGWVSVGISPEGGYLPMWLFVSYPHQLFFAFYEFGASSMGSYVVACPDDRGPSLAIWSKEDPLSVEALLRQALGPPVRGIGRPIVDLMEGIGMTIEGFCTAYSGPPSGRCIRTPSHLW